MSPAPDTPDERVLVLAPTGRDGDLTCRILRDAGISSRRCADFADLCAAFQEGAGALLVTEEVALRSSPTPLLVALAGQPTWSDVPVLFFATSGGVAGGAPSSSEALRPFGNVTLLERPIRLDSFLSTVRSALRARRRQYQVRDLLVQLEGRVSERDRFLAILGHELRNPLAAILGAVQAIERVKVVEPLVKRMSAIVDRRARHLGRLVDDLLDVSRVTSGRIVLQRRVLDLVDHVARAAQGLEASVTARRQALRLHTRGPVWVDVDPVRLEQIVINLLTNALKYTPSGGRIDVEIGAEEGKALLRVSDSGVGISAEMLPRLFDLFSQAKNTIDRSEGGLGIGLALVKGLVELHGGTVEARSAGLERGSEFTVRLALAPAPPAAAPTREQKSVARRIVLVEDDVDIRESVSMVLEMLGHSVDTFADGARAVEGIERLRPDVAIVDIGLPGMDGYAVARRLRSGPERGTRLIAMTGYGSPEDRRRALEAGFDVQITKPVDASVLATLLEAGPRRATAT